MIRVRHSSSQFLTEENFWQVVIAEGAKIEAATTTGWTPLFYAVVTRNVEVVRVSHDDKRHLATEASTGSPRRRRKRRGDRYETEHPAALRIALRDRRDRESAWQAATIPEVTSSFEGSA